MEHKAGPVFCITIPVRWGDMDANGHVNNAVYATYFEQARIAWFDDVCAGRDGPPYRHLVARLACDYLKAITYPATLCITVAPGRPRRSSFPLLQEIHANTLAGETLARAEVTMVRVNLDTGRSEPLPDWLRSILPG